MRGHFKLLNFLAFSVQTNPSPTICDGPPSPKTGEGFSCFADSTITHGAGVFRFFPKQRRLQLGGSFSASQSALGSSTGNFPDAETLF